MADVFISYKRERRPAARHLEQILTRYGYSVWFDLALVRGADYEEQIQSQLNAAKAVIVLWCGQSVQSAGVRSEASRAKTHGKLVPVLIEPCELPLFSTLEQNIDLTAASGSPRDHALDPVLDDLERLVGRAPVADLKALREYEATWRTMTGGLSLAQLPLEQVAIPDDVAPSPAAPSSGPALDYEFWERQWEKYGSGENLTTLRDIADEAPRLFANQARARIAEIEDEQRQQAESRQRAVQERIAEEKAKAERRRQAEEQERLARERAEVEHTTARNRAEGRIKIDAPIIHGARDGLFTPGSGNAEWFQDASDTPELVVVPAGSFRMGDDGGSPTEIPSHEVTVKSPFAFGRFPVTLSQWYECLEEGGTSYTPPIDPRKDLHPVVDVSWQDAQAYVRWLSKYTGKTYRLPSEAEWEFCCRAETITAYNFGGGFDANRAHICDGYSPVSKGTRQVGQFQPNAWGIHDCHGNVWEWVEDSWHENYAEKPIALNEDAAPWKEVDDDRYVIRGGSWNSIPWSLRSAFRTRNLANVRNDTIGFRVARDLELDD